METTLELHNKNGEIILTKIDDEYYDEICIYRWNLSNGYAKSKEGYLHRMIMSAKEKEIIDHINNDKLDNRKSNLRVVSRSQNAQNVCKKVNCSSNYIGVSFNKGSNKWSSYIKINSVKNSFHFEKEDHAAWWYNQLALKYYGIGAKINDIEEPVDFITPIKIKKILPTGVFLTKNNKYISQLKYNKKSYYLGIFETVENALDAYFRKKEELMLSETPKIKYINSDNMSIIITSSGKEIIVDETKQNELNIYSWYIDSHGYPTTIIKNKHIRMHRYITNANTNDEIVDHINHNKLDCKLDNLRKSNSSLNSHNVSKRKNTTSKYTGVYFDKRRNKYQAEIRKDKQKYFLGLFKTEEEAAKIYNKKALELYGEYANLNQF
jgi:hypothetical protein